MRILKDYRFWFVVIVVAVFIANKGYETFFFRPCSAHHWRQSDGASYALNYYQNDIGFLPSQVHHRHAEDGKAISEFPIVYYIAGQLYHVFGFHDFIIRWIHFAIFMIGLIYITKAARLFTNNSFLTLLPAAFTLTSSYLFYYSANFLPDVAALSLSMVGFYFFLKFDIRKSPWSFVFSFFFFTLAGLLKISGAILLVCSISYLIYNFIFNRTYFSGFRMKQKAMICLIPILSVLILYGWIQYDKYVAEHYHFGGNLFGLLPIWDATRNDILYIGKRIRDIWLGVILAKYTWLFLFSIVILFLRYFKNVSFILRFFIIMSFIGVVLYSLCWYKTFDVHDYYMVNLFCLPILLFFALIQLMEQKQWLTNFRFAYSFYSIVLIIFLNSIYKCRAEQLYRYYGKDYNTFNTSYYRVEPYLRSLGIQRTDRVMSVPDQSPNITLYLMNQIGYSECYNGENYNVNNFINDAGVKYLIIGDSSYLHNPLYEPYCLPEYKLGQFEGISIYNAHKLK